MFGVIQLPKARSCVGAGIGTRRRGGAEECDPCRESLRAKDVGLRCAQRWETADLLWDTAASHEIPAAGGQTG